jgi:hypothetical protein
MALLTVHTLVTPDLHSLPRENTQHKHNCVMQIPRNYKHTLGLCSCLVNVNSANRSETWESLSWAARFLQPEELEPAHLPRVGLSMGC